MSDALILVAETRSDFRQSICEALEESGFRAQPVDNEHALWRALDDLSPGALVLDTALRAPHGLDLCREARDRSDIPIILVGARSTEVDRVIGLELGADDYMPAPYSPRELIARLRAVMRRRVAERRASVAPRQLARFDGWAVNFTRREVADPKGRPVVLTGAEFSLLAVMMEQAQRVIARERLIELAGTRSSDSSDRSIDVLVSRLRRKLSVDGRPAPIVTVRGVGYMFGAAVTYD